MTNEKTKIKFKLWNKKTKKFVEDFREANKLSLGTGGINKHLCIAYANEPDDYLIFCKFTGLSDKKGKEIYEGDRIKVKDNNGKYWIEEVDDILGEGWLYTLGYNKEECGNYKSIEIIGNIYETGKVNEKKTT